jgi:surface antigen
MMNWGMIGKWGGAALMTVAVGSCTATPENCRLNYTATGAVVGAAAGAGVGAAIAASSHASGGGIAAATAGGGLLGGLVGAMAGRQQDQACHEMALKRALDQAAALNEARGYRPARQSQAALGGGQTKAAAPSGPTPRYQSVEWANEATSNNGKIQPLATSEGPSDQVCMTYYDQQNSKDSSQATTGKACRGPDGQWRPAA